MSVAAEIDLEQVIGAIRAAGEVVMEVVRKQCAAC